MSKLPTIESLQAKLTQEDTTFSAWRDNIPDKHWVKLDLSALRIGYEFGKRVHAEKATAADTARLNFLATNPKAGEMIVNGERKQVIFWGISAHPDVTLREAIDSTMKANT